MVDFTKLSAAELDAFVTANQGDLDCEGIDAGDVLAAVGAGRAVVEARTYGFAIVQTKAASDGRPICHLWVVFVGSEHRNAGHGKRLMREVMQRHSRELHMSLVCSGAQRRRFFGRLGFVVEGRDGEWRHMTTNKWHAGTPARR